MVAADADLFINTSSPLVSVFKCPVYFYVCNFSRLARVVHVADSGSSPFSFFLHSSLYDIFHDVTYFFCLMACPRYFHFCSRIMAN